MPSNSKHRKQSAPIRVNVRDQEKLAELNKNETTKNFDMVKNDVSKIVEPDPFLVDEPIQTRKRSNTNESAPKRKQTVFNYIKKKIDQNNAHRRGKRTKEKNVKKSNVIFHCRYG